MALDPTPPVVTVQVSPPAPDGANGWYRGPVSVTWAVSDAESPIVTPTGCAAAAPGDGVAPLTCSATSAGGTTSVPVTIKRDSTPPSTPTFTGIRARKTYTPKSLPKARAVGCTAADPTSGVGSCKIAGYATRLGRHKLTATAVNGAGLTSTATLTYTVRKPAAITKLELAKGVTLAKLSHSGIRVTVRVATGATRLTAKLVARVPKGSGPGTREIVLGGAAKRVGAGTRHLRMTLTARAKRQLLAVSKATIEVTVAGRSGRARNEQLNRSVAVRRTPSTG